MYLAEGAGQRRFALNPATGAAGESHQADRVSLGTGRSPAPRKHQMITGISGLAPPVRSVLKIFYWPAAAASSATKYGASTVPTPEARS
jgi:hypothetical protein